MKHNTHFGMSNGVVRQIQAQQAQMINSGREWDWMDSDAMKKATKNPFIDDIIDYPPYIQTNIFTKRLEMNNTRFTLRPGKLMASAINHLKRVIPN